ncbi:hypothetical protein ACFPOD_18700 [Nitratireductor kimnyeongensis]|uniref:Uncharacterized protein n=1 Tax=Nitratireductor kimnyeongensis TaxID=430679 RepID=A0ABW0TER5_9HYPH|nr:hypothetical protein [Nitratireductor kimnyeongensis]QZZ37519.1 hypothetical protein KW403_18070 [Nitratireductor kimnyeongensis]
MTTASDLSPKFRHVRLELAREKGHPLGDHDEGYDLLVPLDTEGHLDAAEWKKHQTQCRVRRFEPNAEDKIGRLRRKPGGQWYFDYEEGTRDDEIGFRLGEERFRQGEYISISRQGEMHTFQVKLVERL